MLFIEQLSLMDIRRQMVTCLEMIRTKYPSLRPEDYFKKIAVSMQYTSFPPVMDVLSFDELTNVDAEGGHVPEAQMMLRHNIKGVRDSSGSLGLATILVPGETSTKMAYQLFPLDSSPSYYDGSMAAERRKDPLPNQMRTPGLTKDGVRLKATWDFLDEIILRSGLTTAVFTSPNPWEEIRKKTVECLEQMHLEEVSPPVFEYSQSSSNGSLEEELQKAFENMLNLNV